jgi:hypothetical protein
MTLPRILYTQPSDLTNIEADIQGMKYTPVYHNGKLNHWKLLPKVKKNCNCTKKR